MTLSVCDQSFHRAIRRASSRVYAQGIVITSHVASDSVIRTVVTHRMYAAFRIAHSRVEGDM
jgi:hypothetical protein